jgi:hypothetical protein
VYIDELRLDRLGFSSPQTCSLSRSNRDCQLLLASSPALLGPPLTTEESDYMAGLHGYSPGSLTAKLSALCGGFRVDCSRSLHARRHFSCLSEVDCHVSAPAPEHWRAVRRIYAYLKRTKAAPLVLKAAPNSTMTGHSDSDWAGGASTGRSQSGFIMSFGGPVEGALVSWPRQLARDQAERHSTIFLRRRIHRRKRNC